jgi:hypothetical protein
MLELNEPKDAGAVVICVNNGRGLRPIRLLLPHQVYKKDLTELWKKHELGEYGEIVAIPVRSEEYIRIAECDKQKFR